ncbi:hypothetical protein DBR11_03480, partial [Pedobacter sp. HMWF019]|uniref:TolC family protein n=1 Tax=Pedobacter sp. HMWF019 TaxID=2056856 RepID=UPI000D39E32D
MKQKFKIALIFLTFFGYGSYAQESMIDDINYATLDKYIQAAKINFPRKKIFDTNVERAKTGVTAANLSYLDFLTASYYYRPDNKTAIDQTNPYSVNGFQFGATINIGVFLQKPSMTKKAKAELKIAKLEDQEYETTLTNEVKKRYYTYLRLLKDLKIKTQNCQDNSSVVD